MTLRPATLRQIAERSDSLEEFGRHFRDWLHTLRSLTSRPQVAAALQEEPAWLARRFTGGRIADAWLAAYAEYVAEKINRPPPAWISSPFRIAPRRWFAADASQPALRAIALRDSPPPFRHRNLFTPTVDLPLTLSAGRPTKSADEKRRVNADRQRRFRARRRKEWRHLRQLADWAEAELAKNATKKGRRARAA